MFIHTELVFKENGLFHLHFRWEQLKSEWQLFLRRFCTHTMQHCLHFSCVETLAFLSVSMCQNGTYLSHYWFPLVFKFFFFKFFSSCVLCSLINSFVELVAYSSVIRGCCRLQHPKSSSIKITVISTYSLIYIKGFVYIIGVYHCKIFLTAYCE